MIFDLPPSKSESKASFEAIKKIDLTYADPTKGYVMYVYNSDDIAVCGAGCVLITTFNIDFNSVNEGGVYPGC